MECAARLLLTFSSSSAVYLPSSTECAGGKPGMLSLCQDICQIAFTSKLVTLFILYPGARLNGYEFYGLRKLICFLKSDMINKVNCCLKKGGVCN